MRRVQPVDLMLLGTVLLWALNSTVTRYVLTNGVHPLAYATVRYGAASGSRPAISGSSGSRR